MTVPIKTVATDKLSLSKVIRLLGINQQKYPLYPCN